LILLASFGQAAIVPVQANTISQIKPVLTIAATPLTSAAALVGTGLPRSTQAKTAAKPAFKTAAKPASNTAAKPASNTAAKPASKTAAKPSAKSSEKKAWGASELSAFIMSVGKKQTAAKSLFSTSDQAANKINAKLQAIKTRIRGALRAIMLQGNGLIAKAAVTMKDIKKTTGGKRRSRRLLKNWTTGTGPIAPRRLLKLKHGAMDSGNIQLINAFLNDNLPKGRSMQKVDKKAAKKAAEKAKKANKKAKKAAKKNAKKAAKKAKKDKKAAVKKAKKVVEKKKVLKKKAKKEAKKALVNAKKAAKKVAKVQKKKVKAAKKQAKKAKKAAKKQAKKVKKAAKKQGKKVKKAAKPAPKKAAKPAPKKAAKPAPKKAAKPAPKKAAKAKVALPKAKIAIAKKSAAKSAKPAKLKLKIKGKLGLKKKGGAKPAKPAAGKFKASDYNFKEDSKKIVNLSKDWAVAKAGVVKALALRAKLQKQIKRGMNQAKIFFDNMQKSLKSTIPKLPGTAAAKPGVVAKAPVAKAPVAKAPVATKPKAVAKAPVVVAKKK
jgi:hypothetical protein